jgi:hypothetical protein
MEQDRMVTAQKQAEDWEIALMMALKKTDSGMAEKLYLLQAVVVEMETAEDNKISSVIKRFSQTKLL